MSPTERPANAGPILLPLARAAIAHEFGRSHPADDSAAWLHAPGACFVTLTRHGELRGCIGSLEAHRPLRLDLRANAVAAAFRDPRFAPMTATELHDTEIEVSLLSAMQPLHFADEAEALARLRPDIDGIVLSFASYRSTFLPQVWEQLRDAQDFLAHLKRKAGLPPDFWHADIRLHRYTVAKWKESEQQLAQQA